MGFHSPAASGGAGLGDANTWTAHQTFNDDVIVKIGTGADANLYYDGTDLQLKPAVVGSGDLVVSGGSIELDDSESVTFGTGKDATIKYDGTHLRIDPDAVGTGDIIIDAARTLYINETANSEQTVGICINQGTATDQVISSKQTNVAHGITDQAETDTAWFVKNTPGEYGGIAIYGFSEDNSAVDIRSYVTAVDTGKATTAGSAFNFRAALKSGTDAGAMSSNSNLLTIRDYTNSRFIFDAEGSAHADVEWVAYADHDDIALMNDMESELLLNEDEAKTDRRHALEASGIIGEDSWHMYRGKPHAMVNFTRLAMLHHGAMLQIHEKIESLESKLHLLEAGK